MRHLSALFLAAVLLATPLQAQHSVPTPPAPATPAEPAAPVPPPTVAAPAVLPADDRPQCDERLRVDVDFLYWFLEHMRVPALLTTGAPASGGVLGVPGTELLYGDDRPDSRHGRYVG